MRSTVAVLFQGDSITDCGRRNCGGEGFDCHGLGPGYPGMVAAQLACDRPELKLNFANLGISGNRVSNLYDRWQKDCLDLRPDVLSILIGVNDIWHYFKRNELPDVPRFARVYRELLTWTRRDLPQVKLVLLDPFLSPEVENRYPMVPDVAAERAIVAKLAADFDAVHIKLQEVFDAASKRAPQTHWSADGVHPTPAGQQLIAEAWIADDFAIMETVNTYEKEVLLKRKRPSSR